MSQAKILKGVKCELYDVGTGNPGYNFTYEKMDKPTPDLKLLHYTLIGLRKEYEDLRDRCVARGWLPKVPKPPKGRGSVNS